MIRVQFDEKNKVWSSCGTQTIFNSNLSIGHILLKLMKVHGPKIAQISDDSGEQLTFDELRMKTIRAAQNLQARGYKPKQIFGIMADNVADLAPILFASFCLGCPVNTIFTGWKKPELLQMLQLIEPSVVFCEVNVYDLLVECLNEMGCKAKVFTFNGTRGDSESVENLFKETGAEETFVVVEVDGINDIATISSSSGTTGKFKGICLSHANLPKNLSVLKAGDVYLNTSTVARMTGLRALLFTTIHGVTHVVTTKPFSPEVYLNLIEKYRVTVFWTASFNLIKIAKSGELSSKRDLSSIRHVIASGMRVPTYVMKQLNSYFPSGSVKLAYGMTELSDNLAIDLPKYSGKDTVGRISNGISVKIIDGEGNRCGINVNGEICIKGQYKFLGYYKNEQLTKETVDNEGFFLTGDIGHFDEDANLYIIDRKQNAFRSTDLVWPLEIQFFLLESKQIQNACVVGVPNGICEVPAALVVRENDSKITEKDIYKMVADNFPDSHKLDGGVYLVDEIPMTPSRKPHQKLIKEMVMKLYNEKPQKNSWLKEYLMNENNYERETILCPAKPEIF